MLNIGEGSSKYVKIWEVQEVAENFVKVKGSTGRKDKRNEGQFINTNWFLTFVGDCKDRAAQLQKGDTITILSGNIENPYDKDKDKSYLNVAIFDFYVSSQSQANNDSDGGSQQAQDDDEDVPY